MTNEGLRIDDKVKSVILDTLTIIIVFTIMDKQICIKSPHSFYTLFTDKPCCSIDEHWLDVTRHFFIERESVCRHSDIIGKPCVHGIMGPVQVYWRDYSGHWIVVKSVD